MTKKALKPIAGQKTLFGSVIKSAPTWKCGATYNQEFPIFRNVQRESNYLSFVNAFARLLDRSAHSLQEAKIICDNEWKRVKTDQSIVQQVISANEFPGMQPTVPGNAASNNEQQPQRQQQNLGFSLPLKDT